MNDDSLLLSQNPVLDFYEPISDLNRESRIHHKSSDMLYKKDLKLKSSSKDQLLMAHINTRSMLDKIDEIEWILKHADIDILCISESWLDETVGKESVQIKGYDFKRKDRKGKD